MLSTKTQKRMKTWKILLLKRSRRGLAVVWLQAYDVRSERVSQTTTVAHNYGTVVTVLTAPRSQA